MQNVTVNMTDELTGEIVERTIDAINAMSNTYPCWSLGSETDQRDSLTRWIEERANQQHETILSLNSWAFA